MIPILTTLVAVLGLVFLVGGIVLFILRRRGERPTLSPDQEETQRILNDAFGKNNRWGAGGTAAEMHDHNNHSTDSNSHSSDGDGGH